MRPPDPPRLELQLPPRRAGGALGLTLLLHGLIVWFLLSGIPRRWEHLATAGPITVSKQGGGGGGGRQHGVAYISLPAAPRPAPPPVPERRPPVVARAAPPVVAPRVLPPPAPAETASATPPAPVVAAAGTDSGASGAEGTGPGTGGGEGGGTGGGVGGGTGTTTGGEGGRATAPEPRQLVLPPADYPKDMRGRQVEVTFYVTADGRVDRIAVAPEIRDGGFARKFAEAMRNYRFRPARSPAGAPVPGTTTVTVFF
jgi:TonB family protein